MEHLGYVEPGWDQSRNLNDQSASVIWESATWKPELWAVLNLRFIHFHIKDFPTSWISNLSLDRNISDICGVWPPFDHGSKWPSIKGFYSRTSRIFSAPFQADLHQLFGMLDSDGGGTIDPEEFKQTLTRHLDDLDDGWRVTYRKIEAFLDGFTIW